MMSPQKLKDDHALNLDGVCQITTCSKPYIYRLIATGRFPAPKKIGRKNIWMRSAILKWLHAQPTRRIGLSRSSVPNPKQTQLANRATGALQGQGQ
ncbi:MAG: AlpA family phage regulatory protein [Chromatiales bacterium]|jgi:excisionase family DNA binding protein|nr:AlpA family phage regulatory protein [Chromatiales bacterium]